MAVLAVPARQTVQTVWTVLARQTVQDRNEPADQVEGGLLDRQFGAGGGGHGEVAAVRRCCPWWNW